MFRHFNYGVFLTTLGLISVAHAIDPDIERAIAEYSRKLQSQQYGVYGSSSGTSENVITSTELRKRVSRDSYNKYQKPMTIDDSKAIDSMIKSYKRQQSNSVGEQSVTYKCWAKNGEIRIIKKDDLCDGTMVLVNTKTTPPQSTPEPPAINKIIPSAPFAYGFKIPVIKKINDYSLSSSSSSNTNFPLINENSSKLSTQSFSSKYPPAPVVKPVLSLSFKNKDAVPSSSQKTDDYSSLQQLINSASTGTTPASQNKPSLPAGSKEYTLPNGTKVMASMPKEIPVEYHSYEPALGLKDNEVREIRDQVFKQTNFYRNMYGINLLTLNENMNNHAQKWANTIASLKRLKPRTASDNDLYGENLYASSQFDKIGKEAVNTWYNELRYISVNDGEEELHKNPSNIGHLIQLLWKATKEMGVGVAKSDKGEYYIAADYNPKGDVYPFLKDNLPEFKQSDIDAAKSAQQSSSGEVKVITTGNDQVMQTVTTITELSDPEDYYKTRVVVPKHSPVNPYGLTSIEVAQMCQDVVTKSNWYRKKFGIQELTMNNEMNYYSQEWANHLARNNIFKHRPDDGNRLYGENLHKSQHVLHVGEVAVDLWYYEIGLVNEDDDENALYNNNGAGHLTQLFWRASKEMGCGAAKSSENRIYIAANYNPTGNVQQLYLKNLPRFTRAQIDEGRRLQDHINELMKQQRKIPQTGQIVELPGWHSDLYVKNY